MNKIRKLFRGSGRAFAFIFAASIIWLLFDMAALKFSFSEINTRVLKEEMIRKERERFRVWRNPEDGPGGGGGRWSRENPEAPPPPPTGLERDERGAERNHEEEANRAEDGVGKGGERQRPSTQSPQETMGLHRTIPAKAWGRPPQPSSAVLLEKKARGAVSVSSPPQTKPALQRGDLKPPSAAEGQPLVQMTHRAALVKSEVAQEVLKPFRKGSMGRKEVSFKTGLVDKGSLAVQKQELPTGSEPKEPRDSLRVLRAPKFPVNRTGGIKSVGGVREATRRVDLPGGKLATSKAAEEKGGSMNATGPGKVPKEEDAKIARANEVLSEEQVVIISKEGAQVVLPASQNPPADAKGKRLIEKNIQLIDDKSKDNLKAVNVTKAAGLIKVAATKAILAEGTKLGNVDSVNLVDKDQLRKINHSDSAIHFTENTKLHKVLAIDRTLGPRDPTAPGQFGRPAVVPGEKQEEAKRRWNEGNFNVYLSDLIPVDRAIDDTRPIGCSDLLVHNDLPTTSIIMCFVDEVWSTLLRSVHSVLNRSPPQFIKEVILVDDFSSKAYLKDKLDKYMARFPKVRILHLKERHGLIRARLAGAEIAKGDVLTFLDSHVECNVGWLEPLLDRIHLNRKKVACPVIEVISDKDMSYMTVDSFQRGIFTWPMNFGWKPIPPDVIEKKKIKETDIIRCPVMAGGLFSIDKKYFFELGTYDPGLDVWGGENMEISFKVWMCGGEIEIIPCSRVGHIFRNDNPYSFPKDRLTTVEQNLARVAEVWLDEYKDLFYGHGYHLIQKNLDVGNLTQQKELRKQLQCKSFKWYLENVYPDLEAPLVKASGLIINIALAKCITVNQSSLTFETCDVNNKHQKFNYTWLRLIQHGESCVAPMEAKGTLGLHPCDKRNNSLKWLHKSLVAFHPELMDHIVLEHLPRATCLEVDPSQKALRANICSSSSLYQKWQFGNYYAD
ncbi:polypeptide N-acetylgalactosaminyltransferase 5 [Elgaria multicarinata webbii]|uniref:polypeptide N-acetylgalactosaminyltransferase 5 n=1 Tax=Elgaria multicarinata webbii TaxID=159646 RepID=UPI002FCCBB3C